jgi:HAD superfamily hydrolase (TIGR01509 family)
LESQFLPALKQVMSFVRKPQAPLAFSFWQTYFQQWNVHLSETEFFDFWFSGEKLVPELVNYAQSLRTRGIKVFILSNNFKERTEFYRKNFPGIFTCIDKAYFSWETGFVKPSLEALNLVLCENNLQPQVCVYFDDSDANVELAKSLGIRAEKWIGVVSAKKVIDTLL